MFFKLEKKKSKKKKPHGKSKSKTSKPKKTVVAFGRLPAYEDIDDMAGSRSRTVIMQSLQAVSTSSL